LFVGGVGRFFEGTAEEMYSNFKVIASLPDQTHIFPGHEYTKSNLLWSSKVDLSNKKIKEKLNEIESKKIDMVLPSSIGEEKEINIFMRCDNEDLQKRLNTSTGEDTMRVLREMKNNGKVLV
jgi:hydroxyacylglutathione hydrolase